MYIPSRFREDDREWQLEFMRRHGFAVVVSVSEGRPVATHLPLTVKVAGEEVFLRGHFAKANPQWRGLEDGEVLAVFNGPHAYVSPRHYDAFESVPTWNYLTVHAHGEARVIHDASANEELLYELVQHHEPGYWQRWQSLSQRYREGMLRGIVGFELRVTRLEGKAKLSQNKTAEERRRIAAWLSASDDPLARATGEEMTRREEAERGEGQDESGRREEAGDAERREEAEAR